MWDLDPSESIRSGEILSVWRQYFSVEHCIDLGGNVTLLVCDNIASNFKYEDPESVRRLKRVLTIDHWARRLRLVPAINVMLAGKSEYQG